MGLNGGEARPVRWRFANAEYNERSHELLVAGQPVALEPKPLEVLLCLLRAEGELVTKQELFDTVWAGRVVTDGVLSQAIRRIREVLGDADRTRLRTVHGYGFRLDVPIEIEGRDDPGTRLRLEPGDSLPNLPDWLLEERLQTRPANELWRIRHPQSGELRVVKLALDERAQRALKREVTLNKVMRADMGDDAPLVPVLAWQFDTDPAWIQMPWYEQGSLVDWLGAQGGPLSLPLERRLKIVAEAAEALAQAHALGVMHKDIKPGNLLVEHSGPEPRLLLCDFGSGTVKSRERLEQSGVTVMGFTKTVHAGTSTSGTPAYMAPEVLKGGVFSELSDVYALGILLYQLVIGDLSEPMAAGWEEDVADPTLRAIIAEACAGKPARRIDSMQDLARRVRAWQPQDASAPRPEGAPQSGRRHAAVLAALLVLVVAVAGGLWVASRDNTAVEITAGIDSALADPAGSRVAILPFELLGLDAQTETVMAGLQDALVSDLANLAGIRLVQGQNLERLGLTEAPVEKIGAALKVERLIRGSIQQLGEQVRVNLQLVDSRRGETVWGQAIQGTRSNLFAVQADIARALAMAIGAEPVEVAEPTVNNAAYEAYLAALSMWKQGHGKGEEKLAEHLKRALELEPGFVDAHLLALLVAARDYWFSTITRTDAEEQISEHLAALEKQNTPPVKLATARAVRTYYLENDPAGGVEILAPFRRNLLQNTESALFYAYMLRRIGRVDEALNILDQVVDLDPSVATPVDTKAELLAFMGRGGDAITLLNELAEQSSSRPHARIKTAMFGYMLTGDLRFLEWGEKALANVSAERKNQYYTQVEMARRQQDWPTVRELARGFEGEDKSDSGHGRVPWELGVALALRVGQAPADEVRAHARAALEKLQRWRAISDSDSRRSTMAVVLALLDRGEEAQALSNRVEAAYPIERDYMLASEYLLDAASVHALLGDEAGVLSHLKKIASSRFISLSLCSVPYELQQQPVWDMPAAKAFIIQQCAPSWERNRRDILPFLNELPA